MYHFIMQVIYCSLIIDPEEFTNSKGSEQGWEVIICDERKRIIRTTSSIDRLFNIDQNSFLGIGNFDSSN